jgi:hypothetical protein
MSVHKNKRNLSSLEFHHNARNLREEMTNFLLRDFGVRDKVTKYKDGNNVEVTIREQYPDWIITFFRESIMNILRDLMLSITAANTIYPITPEELSQRRMYQNKAIVSCQQLLCELTHCADVLPVELGKFTPYIEKISFEIKLLKGWRKSSNDLAKRIQSKNKTGGNESR